MPQLIVISGCSGGGKSTLLEALGLAGEKVVPEPGRRIVAEELAGRGVALPWVDAEAFSRRAVALSLSDIKRAEVLTGRVFFDRGLIDAAAALEHATGEAALEMLGRRYRFHDQVFLAPPWPELYRADNERRHGFDAAVAEYHRLRAAYQKLGYEIVELPKISVPARVDLVLSSLPGR